MSTLPVQADARYGDVTASAAQSLHRALEAIGLHGQSVRHIRTAHYAVFAFSADSREVLARVGGPEDLLALIAEAGLTAELASLGAPVPEPELRLAGLPWANSVHSIGLWRYVDHDPAVPIDSAAIGAALAAVHRHGQRVEGALAQFKAPGKVHRRLDDLDRDPRGAIAPVKDLRAALKERSADLQQVSSTLEVGLVHGDFQPGNLLSATEGVMVVDFETSCRGPLHWDLTTLEGRCRRGEYPHLDFGDIVSSYVEAGGTEPDPDAFAALVSLRDLSTAVWAWNEQRLDPSSEYLDRAWRLTNALLSPG